MYIIVIRFYEKATLIRQCQEKYEAAQIEYARAQETLKEKTRSLRQLGAEFKKANARYRYWRHKRFSGGQCSGALFVFYTGYF